MSCKTCVSFWFLLTNHKRFCWILTSFLNISAAPPTLAHGQTLSRPLQQVLTLTLCVNAAQYCTTGKHACSQAEAAERDYSDRLLRQKVMDHIFNSIIAIDDKLNSFSSLYCGTLALLKAVPRLYNPALLSARSKLLCRAAAFSCCVWTSQMRTSCIWCILLFVCSVLFSRAHFIQNCLEWGRQKGGGERVKGQRQRSSVVADSIQQVLHFLFTGYSIWGPMAHRTSATLADRNVLFDAAVSSTASRFASSSDPRNNDREKEVWERVCSPCGSNFTLSGRFQVQDLTGRLNLRSSHCFCCSGFLCFLRAILVLFLVKPFPPSRLRFPKINASCRRYQNLQKKKKKLPCMGR